MTISGCRSFQSAAHNDAQGLRTVLSVFVDRSLISDTHMRDRTDHH